MRASATGNLDSFRLEQLVVNLLSNALKYGEGKPIEIAVTPGDDRVVMRVRDHGIGIDLRSQDRIFERFERAVSVNYGGLGLGTCITPPIVTGPRRKNSGESNPRDSSTFPVHAPGRAPQRKDGAALMARAACGT